MTHKPLLFSNTPLWPPVRAGDHLAGAGDVPSRLELVEVGGAVHLAIGVLHDLQALAVRGPDHHVVGGPGQGADAGLEAEELSSDLSSGDVPHQDMRLGAGGGQLAVSAPLNAVNRLAVAEEGAGPFAGEFLLDVLLDPGFEGLAFGRVLS